MELDEPESDDVMVRTQVAKPEVDVDIEELGLHSNPYYELDTDSMVTDSDSESSKIIVELDKTKSCVLAEGERAVQSDIGPS